MLKRRCAIDIVHVHGDIAEIFFGRLVSNLYKAKLIVTFHAGLNQKIWYKYVSKYILQKPDSIICVSQDIAQQVKDIDDRVKSIHVIHSGIFRDRYLTRRLNKYPKVLRVLSIGRLHSMKGYDYLIKAVSDKIFENKLELVLVGDGPTRKYLEQLSENVNIKIQFLGQASKEKVISELGKSHLFVSSSIQLGKQTEGTPTVVMEAMAAGLPVIATDVGGSKYLIENEKNGFIVAQKSADAIRAVLFELTKNPETLKLLSKNNVNKSAAFDWEVIGKKIFSVYQSAMIQDLGYKQ